MRINIKSLSPISRSMISKRILHYGLILVLLIFTLPSQAQCAMCRAALESEDGGNKAEAVNDGIVYLMVIPYVLVGILGVVLYRMYTKKKA
jgi:hypothetical protein